ncbi:LuxR family transcriptional regulator [Dactylosporangium sp. NPDC049140]|uniref:LuxR family transcriptional regulator n=1 Tax=Dactylosporangium sp. NPDC049140 TaxID=3155647 RepID=UPI0033F8D89F
MLIVDDDPYVRLALTAVLRDADFEVTEASSGEAAVEAAAALSPDLIVMDILMPPGITGIEATRRIVECNPNARVVMFSVYETTEIVSAALAAGATSYVTKHTPRDTLLDALVRTHAGQSVAIPAPNPSAFPGLGPPLGSRGREILDLAVHGLTAQQIGDRLELSPRTVEGHLQAIYARLGVSNRVDLVRTTLEGQVFVGGSFMNPPAGAASVNPKDLLTDREHELVRLIGRGLTNRQIATRTGRSTHTVNYHLRQIFRKLGISSRVELAEIARQLDTPPSSGDAE